MSDTGKSIESIREGWMLWSWSRRLGVQNTMSPRRRRELTEKLAAAPDDQRVVISAGELRNLLAVADPPLQRGARLRGTGKNEGVMYSATVDTEGGRRLRSIEIDLIEDSAYPQAFRVPVRLVEDLTRYVLAAQDTEAAWEGTDPADVLVVESGIADDGKHSTDLLFEWVANEKIPPKGLATMLGLSERRIYQMLSDARRERPDLDWPPPSRGPRPKTTDGK